MIMVSKLTSFGSQYKQYRYTQNAQCVYIDTSTHIDIVKELPNTHSTKFWLISEESKSIAARPLTNSRRNTPKLYMSLFSEKRPNSLTLHQGIENYNKSSVM